MLRAGLAALALLTRVPVRRAFAAAEIARATPFFPLIGAFVGTVQILLLHLLVPFLPPLLVSSCLLGATALLTGALHLDGLADMADGLGGGDSREDILRIMRDPAIGSYGAVAVILVLTTRVTALAALIERGAAGPFLLLASTLSRWTMVALASALSYARPEGGVGSAVDGVSRGRFVLATVVAATVSVCAGTHAAGGWLAALGVTSVCGGLGASRLGGFTGDVLGANSELTETAVLIAGVVLTR